MVLLDVQLPRVNGLLVCREIKTGVPAPAVVLYSAYEPASLAVPAALAGADGLVHKGAPTRELIQAVRAVAEGARVLPCVTPELLAGASAALQAEDRPVLAMLLDGTPPGDVAQTLGVDGEEIARRRSRMLARLCPRVPGLIA